MREAEEISARSDLGGAGTAPPDPHPGSQIGAWCLTLVVLVLSGCGRHAVRASEKEFLADQVMVFDDDGQEAAADEHVLTNREGSAGGRGSKGGGCGCN